MRLRLGFGVLVVLAACSTVPDGEVPADAGADAGQPSPAADAASEAPKVVSDAAVDADAAADAAADASVDADADAGPPVFAGNHVWSKRFGGPIARSGVQAIDASGNLYIAGEVSGPISFGGDVLTDSAFIAKFDAAGNHVWSKGISGPVRSVLGGDPILTRDRVGINAIRRAFRAA